MTFPVQQNRMMTEQVMDKIHHVSLAGGESYDMEVYDHVVLATQTGTGAVTINLPDVASAAGMMYFVYAVGVNADAINVKALADAVYTETDICAVADDTNVVIDIATGAELSDAGEYVLLVSTGISWHILASHAIA